MSRLDVDWRRVVLPSALAALTSWVTLLSWSGFVARQSGYLAPALMAALLVGVIGAGLRVVRVPAVGVLAAQVVGLVLWLTHRWVPETAVGGWLPTGESLPAALTVLADGVAVAQNYAAPVPPSEPAINELLLAFAVVVVLLVDLLACGMRRVPVAGLPLLAVYTAPVSILADGVPWWVFALGAVSFLAMIVTDETERLVRWGRPMESSRALFGGRGEQSSGTSLRMSGRRIGLTATAVAVVAPLVVPTFSVGLLSGSGPGQGGGDSVAISNPLVNLRRDLVRGADLDLVEVETSGDPTYLRLSVLDTFTGASWRPSDRDIPTEQRADGELPMPPGLDEQVARTEVDFDISVTDAFDTAWLPTPYPVRQISVPGDWRYDSDTLDFVSALEDQDAAGLEYELRALEVRPTVEDLLNAGATPESVFTPYTELPEDIPDLVSELAEQVTAQAETRFERAVLLQRWFRQDGGFQYSLRPDPGTGTDELVRFLTPGEGGRIGYCEQFAAAMALMGRELGIPSRVAVGFLRPQPAGPDRYVFSAHDLHAWPEMYFEGVGWVRFEPTPSDRAEGVPGYTIGQIQTPTPTDLPTVSAPTATPGLPGRQPDEGAAPAGGSGDDGSGPAAWVTRGVAALVVVALLAAPWAARRLVGRLRWAAASTPAEAAEAGWSELRDVALDLRYPWDDTVTLRTRAGALALLLGRPGLAVTGERADELSGRGRGHEATGSAAEPALALSRLVLDVERARFTRAGADVAGRDPEEVRADVERVDAALRAAAGARRRRWAVLLPASLWRNGAWRSLVSGPSSGAVLVDGVDRPA